MVRGGIEDDDSFSLVPSFGRNVACREPALVGGPRRGTLSLGQPLPFPVLSLIRAESKGISANELGTVGPRQRWMRADPFCFLSA